MKKTEKRWLHINWFGKAAQAWCHESTKHLDMIPELAMVFALILKEQHDLLTAALAEKEGEIERLRVQLAGCGVAAMCNTKQSREQQKCVEGAYGWSQSYQDVVNAVGREIDLREKLQAAESLADSRLADQESIERHVTKRVAGECASLITEWPYRCIAGAEAIRKKYGVAE